tara:strand:+ start:729 stop:1430 length:702 start_codon:yes stop_codon:yes gene_type:complete
MPMAGKGFRLQEYDSKPKPLVNVLGKPIVHWAIETLGLEGNYIFCCKKEHIEKYGIDKILKKIIPNCKIISIDFQTRGPVESILEAKNLIDNDEELIISDTDHYLEWDHENFNNKIRKQDIDGCTMVFPGKYDLKKSSFVKLDNKGFVIESAEKQVISDTATVGVHYFKKGSDFVKYANEMISKKMSHNNEFFITPIYNLFAKDKKKISTYPIKKMLPLGSSDEVNLFLKNFS